jgi:hypothetical protein
MIRAGIPPGIPSCLPTRAPSVARSARKGAAHFVSGRRPRAHTRTPINCVNWFFVYAFCAWDDGWLPTRVEWDYAARGGAEQRTLPWSVPPSDRTLDPTYATYDCAGAGVSGCDPIWHETPVGVKPKGNGRFGQSDLIGNVTEVPVRCDRLVVVSRQRQVSHRPNRMHRRARRQPSASATEPPDRRDRRRRPVAHRGTRPRLANAAPSISDLRDCPSGWFRERSGSRCRAR